MNDPDDRADDVILDEQTAAPGPRTPSAPSTLTPHDLATPYVLDALELDEREAFERHLINCHDCQVRVADLEDAALLLPDALVTPPADLPDAFPYLLRDVAHETLPYTADSLNDDFVADEEDDVIDDTPEDSTLVDDADAGFTPVEDDPETPADIESVVADEIEAGDPSDQNSASGDVVSPEPDDAPEEPGQPDESAEIADPVEPAKPVTGKRNKSRNRNKQAVAAAANAAPATEARPPAAAVPDYATVPARPPGRIRPGVRPAPSGDAAAKSSAGGFQITPPVLAALALGLIALGLFLWALLLLGRVGDLEDEVAQQDDEITALRQQANATAFTLTPTSNGPADASGTFFVSLPDQQAALVVRGLEQAPNEWAYQVWFIDDEQAAPLPGPTFQVDENGDAVLPLTADYSTFDGIAVSLEPANGSPAPTSQLILQGELGGAAG